MFIVSIIFMFANRVPSKVGRYVPHGLGRRSGFSSQIGEHWRESF
jgi:hypothetical protein